MFTSATIKYFLGTYSEGALSITSLQFVVFVAAVCALYYIVPKCARWCVLLLANVFFYFCAGLSALLCLVLSTAIAYFAALFIGRNLAAQKKKQKTIEGNEKRAFKKRCEKKRRRVLALGVFLVLLVLVAVKYLGFIFETVGIASTEGAGNILDKIPAVLGCSYFTLMHISYMTDVYRSKYAPQKNFLKYFVFASFFPHIVQGPIDRYDTLAPRLYEGNKWNFDNIKTGVMLIVWGYFKKLIIADRLAPAVNTIFSEYTSYGGPMIFFGTVLFSFQLYADWTAYCDIVGGAAEMLGIKITQNFNRPYFSQNLPEFWRRWHMSMGAFFKEYVLYPVSASKLNLKINKFARKVFGNNSLGRAAGSIVPIISVWLLTGLWHGAGWCFVLWGLYQGVLILLSIGFTPTLEKLNKKLNFKTETFGWKLFRALRTFFLCCIGRLFFNATDMKMLAGLFKGLTRFSFSLKEYSSLNISLREWAVVAAALAVMLLAAVLQEKYEVRKALNAQPILVKWPVLIAGVAAIVLFGVYGVDGQLSSFVYEQF